MPPTERVIALPSGRVGTDPPLWWSSAHRTRKSMLSDRIDAGCGRFVSKRRPYPERRLLAGMIAVLFGEGGGGVIDTMNGKALIGLALFASLSCPEAPA